jgi:hypothetical protein
MVIVRGGKGKTKRARKRGHEGRMIIRHIAKGTMKDVEQKPATRLMKRR